MYQASQDISDALARRIAEDRAAGWTNPWRCRDDDVIRREATARDEATLLRPPFVRDIEKIMNTPAYNRYTGKTQVFSFRSNDDLCRRGLHVQLVARVARDIGRALGLNLDLIEAIALGHDIGHTPFGHAGERALDAVYNRRTGRHFRHNLQSLRVLDRMYARNVSLQTLDGIVCHNGEYEQRAFRTSGITTFDQLDEMVERCCVEGDDAIEGIVPMTLEGCVVRVSDIVAYVGKDRQDAEIAGIVDEDTDFRTGAAGAYNAWVLRTLIADIVENSYGKDHIEMSEEAFAELAEAKRENYRLIYRNEEVSGECGKVIAPMFERLYCRLADDLAAGDESSPIFSEHIDALARHTGYYGRAYDWESDLEQTVVDYLASLTDAHFVALDAHLFPDAQIDVPFYGYYGSGDREFRRERVHADAF